MLKTVRHDAGTDAVDAAVLRHEYEVLHDFDVPGVVRALALNENEHGPVLVLRDAGPANLADWRKGQALDLARFFDLAIPIARALAALHQRAVLHRDLSPTNIVLDERLQPTLIDFETATHVTAVPGPSDEDTLAGTLPYMAPEQTGRMQRAVDHRSDLYALGAICYELLTGRLPLSGDDPAVLMHAILAEAPAPPNRLRPGLPVLLSDMLLKLLAKMPEQRYQSAEALVADLELAQQHWLRSGAIPHFELGSQDRGELVLPDRLFGRDAEQLELLAGFSRVRSGACELALISGPPGVGKSALVAALERRVGDSSWFGAGKVEPHGEAAPYGVVSAALARLAQQLARAPSDFRQRLRAAVGATGRVLTELVPELEEVLGQLPSVPELGPTETQNRLHLALLALLRACGTQARPVVLFFDDLQWADAGSLQLLEVIANTADLHHLFVIGAHRSPMSAPLTATLSALRNSQVPVRSIALTPLDTGAITLWLSEALACSLERARPLANAVLHKTGGDPLFVTRLLQRLHRSRLLVWDPVAQVWHWDLSRIAEVGTEDVIALMLAALQALPPGCRRVLGDASCIGSHFDLWLLAQAYGASIEETASQLAPALQEGLLAVAQPRFRPEPEPADPSPGLRAAYRFVHDRIQQAAQALLDEGHASEVHLQLARSLDADITDAELDRRLFEIVAHYHRAERRISSPAERLRLCALDHRAGRKAMQAAAYGLALGHLQRGLALLPGDAFETQRSLALGLHQGALVCAYMTEQPALAEALLGAALARSSRFERAELYDAALGALTSKGGYAQAIDYGRAALAEFGVELPRGAELRAALAAELEAAERGCKERTIESLLNAPEMRDPEARASTRLLAHLIVTAWATDQPLVGWLTLRMVNLSLRHGNAPELGLAYAIYGHIRAQLGDVALGRSFGQLGVALSRRFGDPLVESRALLAFGVSLNHWAAPLRTSVPIIQQSVAKALESGELVQVMDAKSTLALTFMALGEPLGRTLAFIEATLLERAGTIASNRGLLAARQALRCLQGRTHGPARFDGPGFERPALEAVVADVPVSRALYEVLRLQVAYLARDFAVAAEAAEAAGAELALLSGLIPTAEYAFYAALTWLARAELVTAEAPQLLARVAENHGKLAGWAEKSPENFRHKQLLVAAELARLRGDTLEAQDLYDRAIEGAAQGGFLQDQGLANELAGRFRLALGRHSAALSYLSAAKAAYQSWGATAKVRALAEELPALDQALAWGRSPPNDELGSSALDLHSVIKASETISRELDFDHLIGRLMEVCLEAAGAERGALVLEQDSRAMLRAVASSGNPVQLECSPVETSELVPAGIVREALRTGEALVLADATQDTRFATDPYVARHNVRSALAVPIRRQARVIGVLYLENNLATRVFSASRVRILRTLSSQIAVSLAHSQLFETLSREIDERRRAQAGLHFLADSAAPLAESLDYRATLSKAARIAVPFLADACAVDMLVDGGERSERVAVAHVDPTQQELLHDPQRFPPQGRDSDARTIMSVPLTAHGRTIGVLHLGLTAARRRYGPDDAPLALELARRMALAIENARLYRESQQAIQAREEFLSVASHELRTPLHALQLSVQGMGQSLERVGHEADVERRLALIERQTGRLARLIEKLLDVSRIHAGRLDIELEPVDLSALVREVAGRFGAELSRAGCALSCELQPGIVGNWDRLRLDQVITNLLSNAIKFGAGRPVEVSLASTGNRVRLAVTDHGIGIAPDQQRPIFERFERAVPTRSYGGLGLGLYISRTIVEALGGAIRVASEPGAGSTFTVELPIRSAPGSADSPLPPKT